MKRPSNGEEMGLPNFDLSSPQKSPRELVTSANNPINHTHVEDDDDDNWGARAWQVFSDYARRGVLTVEQYVQFASEMSVDCDASVVERVMKAEKMASITFKNAIRMLEVIPQMMLADDNDEVDQDDGGNTNHVVVNPFEYAWRVWFCGERDPEVEYVVSNTFKCTPQFWLLFVSSMVFMIVAAAITAFISVFWLQNALDRDFTNLESLQKTLSLFSNAIAAVSLTVSGRDLEDNVVTLSRWMEQVYTQRVDAAASDVRVEMTEDSVMLQGLGSRTVTNFESEIASQLAAFLTVLTVTPVAVGYAVKAIENWAADMRLNAYALDHNTGTVMLNSADISAAQMTSIPCVAKIEEYRNNLNSGNISGSYRNTTTLDGMTSGYSAWQRFGNFHFSVCVSATNERLQRRDHEVLVKKINRFNEIERSLGREVASREYVLFNQRPRDDAMTPVTYHISSERQEETLVCNADTFIDSCRTMEGDLHRCLEDKCTHGVVHTVTYYGRPAIMYMNYIESANAVVGVVVDQALQLANFEKFLIDGANLLNSEFVKTTEIVVSLRDALGKIQSQVTDFRFSDSCLIPCRRPLEARTPMYEAFRNRASYVSIHPDYTFRPVVGASSLMIVPGRDIAFVIERDVPELRGIALGLIVDSFDQINGGVDGSTEIVVFQRDGIPPVDTFDPTEPCPPFVHCVTHPDYGVIWRADCVDCLRRPVLNTTEENFLSSLRFTDRCPANFECVRTTGVLPKANKATTRDALLQPSEQVRKVEAEDYSGVQVTSFVSYIRNFSAYLQVKKDTEEVVRPILNSIIIYVVVAVVLCIFGVVGLVLLSRRTLNRIEGEWRSYKGSIEREKMRFDGMIKEIVPSNVFQRFQRGQRAVAEAHSTLAFSIINIVGFSELYKQITPRQLVRSLAYYFILYEAVATRFRIFRLKSYGDVCVFVSGLLSSKDHASASAWAIAQFSAYVSQLLTPCYCHYPHRIPQLADAFNNDNALNENEPARIQPVRIGLHMGPATGGLIDYGKTPFFEVYGPSLAMTHRMMQAASPMHIHVSSSFKDNLEVADTEGLFEFDTVKKMVVRGAGAVSSYPVKSVHLPVDDVLLHRMKIEYSRQLHEFRKRPGGPAPGARSESHLNSSEGWDDNATSSSRMTDNSASASLKDGEMSIHSRNSQIDQFFGRESSSGSTSRTSMSDV